MYLNTYLCLMLEIWTTETQKWRERRKHAYVLHCFACTCNMIPPLLKFGQEIWT